MKNLSHPMAMTPEELAKLQRMGLVKAPAPSLVVFSEQPERQPRKPRKEKAEAAADDGVKRMVIVANPATPAQISRAGAAAASLDKVESKWVDVTPKKAGEWLRNNYVNRKVKQDVIDSYARDMKNGKWKTTHQGIAFNDKDELIDGQHRLMAIVASGVTVRMMVTFNLPAKNEEDELTTMDCVDRGRTRSVADQLTIQHGFKNANLTASICAALASLCCQKRTRRVNVGEALAIFRQFEQPILSVIADRSKDHGLKAAGVLAGFAFAIAVDGTPVRKMFQALNKGEDLDDLPMMVKLREFLTSSQAVLINSSMDRGLSELTLQAIWLQQQGLNPEKLVMATDGVMHYRAYQTERVEKVSELFGGKI